MSCYLRIFGKRFDVDAFAIRLPEGKYDMSISRKGENRSLTRPERGKFEESILTVTVSDAKMDAFDQQKKDAIRFLQDNETFFTILNGFDTEIKVLDLGVRMKEDITFTKTFFFPAELVALCGKHNIGLELSQYQE